MEIMLTDALRRPSLSARFDTASLECLNQRPEFTKFRAELEQANAIRIEPHDEGIDFLLLARRLGRDRLGAHEQQLRQFVKLLEWGSIGRVALQKTLPCRLVSIDSTKGLEGAYAIATEIYWPLAKGKQIADVATVAMKKMGQQLRYGSYDNRTKYNQEIVAYTGYKDNGYRASERDVRGVFLQTAAYNAPCGPNNRYSEDDGIRVRLEGTNIRSHKEQIIHLTGALAIAQADRLV